MDGHDSPSEQSRANGDNDGADSALRTNKRRRIAIACSACRTRKSRVRHDLTSSKGKLLADVEGLSAMVYARSVACVQS
jgi:hypothetical protein